MRLAKQELSSGPYSKKHKRFILFELFRLGKNKRLCLTKDGVCWIMLGSYGMIFKWKQRKIMVVETTASHSPVLQ